jgi:ADP-ribose pyrophosphatase YjhB (NUDIX family)
MTIVAAGILFRAPTGRILLLRRTDGEGWAFPGGAKKEHETIEQCAVRLSPWAHGQPGATGFPAHGHTDSREPPDFHIFLLYLAMGIRTREG